MLAADTPLKHKSAKVPPFRNVAGTACPRDISLEHLRPQGYGRPQTMVRAYYKNGQSLVIAENIAVENFSDVLWMDIVDPTPQEAQWIRRQANIDLPTRGEAQEIEISSRLYQESGATFMTATILINTDSDTPGTSPVTFIYTPACLATLRFSNPRPFSTFAAKYSRLPDPATGNPQKLFGSLMDEIVDRLADILENTGATLNSVSAQLFRAGKYSLASRNDVDYGEVLEKISRAGELAANARESLVSLNRVVGYFCENRRTAIEEDPDAHWNLVKQDIASLGDHATFLSSKVNFFLDAALGRINIEQNTIIKLFSVAAVIFLPPTLIASIYGMNFHHGMPELDWKYGYVFSIVLMVASAVITYVWFKRKHWL